MLIADVELTPPAGRERLYAVWSRAPLAARARGRLGSRGDGARHAARAGGVGQLRPEDWHAVLLVLDHAPCQVARRGVHLEEPMGLVFAEAERELDGVLRRYAGRPRAPP